MRIDFSKLPTLIGPRFQRIRTERFDRERLARVKHANRKRPKNHSTNRERAHLAIARAAETRKYIEDKKAAWVTLREQIRAYWRGERDNYPRG